MKTLHQAKTYNCVSWFTFCIFWEGLIFLIFALLSHAHWISRRRLCANPDFYSIHNGFSIQITHKESELEIRRDENQWKPVKKSNRKIYKYTPKIQKISKKLNQNLDQIDKMDKIDKIENRFENLVLVNQNHSNTNFHHYIFIFRSNPTHLSCKFSAISLGVIFQKNKFSPWSSYSQAFFFSSKSLNQRTTTPQTSNSTMKLHPKTPR